MFYEYKMKEKWIALLISIISVLNIEFVYSFIIKFLLIKMFKILLMIINSNNNSHVNEIYFVNDNN